jgi:hypothetical protein
MVASVKESEAKHKSSMGTRGRKHNKSKKNVSGIRDSGIEWPEIAQRPSRPTIKIGPGCSTSQTPQEVSTMAKGFINHAFEGEGDAFSWKKKETPTH